MVDVRIVRKFWLAIIAVVVLLMLSSCKTYTKYYPPTPEFSVKVKNDKGEVIEIRGAIQEEGTEPDLGTEGMGEYYLIKGSVL